MVSIVTFQCGHTSHPDRISILLTGDRVVKVGWLHTSLSAPRCCKVATVSLLESLYLLPLGPFGQIAFGFVTRLGFYDVGFLFLLRAL